MSPNKEQIAITKLLRKYDGAHSFNISERINEGLTKGEVENWANHPCTLSLLAALDGEICDVVGRFLMGDFTSEESTDGTAQLQAKARGMASAYYTVIQHIEDIKDLEKGEVDAS